MAGRDYSPSMTPSEHVIPSEIETDRFVLRRLCSADAPELLGLFSDPRVMEFLDFDDLASLEEAGEIVGWADRLHEGGRGVRWSIRQRDTGEFLGTCGFNTVQWKRGARAEVAYDLLPSHWGQGVMKEVLRRVLEVGFHDLGMRRIEARVTPGNERSAGLLSSLGFTEEGRLRQVGFWRGRYWDLLVFSLLDEELGSD
ncbi:MAG: GNAT family protein [Acidobacteriota bacterium]